VFHGLVGLQVVAHGDVVLAGQQQLQHVDLRAAHLDGDVQPVLLVRAFGQGLVEAAVFGLGVPVRAEDELVGGRGGLGVGLEGQDQGQGGQEARHGGVFHMPRSLDGGHCRAACSTRSTRIFSPVMS